MLIWAKAREVNPAYDLSLVAPRSRAYSRIESSRSMPTRNTSAVFNVGVTIEHRRSRRYQLQAPASFLWERPDGLLREGKGEIRDISDRGVFVSADVVPPPGAHLDVDVYLPSLEVGAGAVRLHGEGTVLRVEREANSTKGFAAAVAFQTEAASGPTVVNPREIH